MHAVLELFVKPTIRKIFGGSGMFSPYLSDTDLMLRNFQ